MQPKTKLIPELRDKSYQDRLKHVQLPSLYQRQKKGDRIQSFKTIKGFDKIPPEKFFMFSKSSTQCHNFKL